MAIDPFDSPFLLLERARENREELNARAKAFFDAHPYAQFVERDVDTGHFLRKIIFTSELPPGLWSVAADALNNLRGALDQGVCASVVTLTPTVSLDQVFFPFADSKAHFEKTVARLTAKVHPRVASVFGFLQPNKGGNERLWALKNLTNANKHRTLVRFGAAVDSIEVNTLELPGPGPILKPYWDRAKNEIVVSRTVDDIDPRYDLNVSFHISFGDIEGLSGKPVVEAIDYLNAIVGAFLTGLQSDTQAILAGKSF